MIGKNPNLEKDFLRKFVFTELYSEKSTNKSAQEW